MTKEELRAYAGLKRERTQVENKLRELEHTIQAIEVRGSAEGSDCYRRNLKVLLAHYRDLLERVTAEQLAIEQAIDRLEPTERTLMRYRYIEGETWEDICKLMHYSWRSVHRLHAGALIRLNRGQEHGEK